MDMKHGKLQRLLEELQQELDRLPESARKPGAPLHQLSQDVEAAVRRIESPDAGELNPDSLVGRLRDALSGFEGTHPALAGVVNNVINTLTASGV
jgi:hypothetical protein